MKEKVSSVLELVKQVRLKLPKVGVRKLYELIFEELRQLGIGRDKLFCILRANKLLICHVLRGRTINHQMSNKGCWVFDRGADNGILKDFFMGECDQSIIRLKRNTTVHYKSDLSQRTSRKG